MTARLHVQPPGGEPFDRPLSTAECIVGRSESAGIVVQDAGVSRRHVRLFQQRGQWWVQDLGARNGTLLNDAPLTAPGPLAPGDRIQIGATVLVFEPGVASGPVTSTAAHEELDRQAARLRTLNEIHRALATPISLSALLDLILERCFDALRPEEGVIVLRQADGSFATAATRRKAGHAGDVLVSRSLIDEVAGHGRPALVLDAAFDERFAGSESIIASGVRSVVAAPLSDADGSIGMIALLSRVQIRMFSEHDLDMLGSLASAAALRVRNIALTEEAAARRVLERELALAHDMQMAMLPRRLPDRPEVEVAASLTPARRVGGDLYDFVVDADRLWFIVADVSGKGVPAALYTAVARALFRAGVNASASVDDVLSRMNAELARDNNQAVFVTALVGCLSLSTGEVMLGDAGHNPAIVRRRDGRIAKPVVPKCLPLGVLDDVVYGHGRFALDPGETLVLYTDGVTDARAPGGDLFGGERLDEVVARCAGDAAEVARAITDATTRFASGAPQEDDLTLLVLRYTGA